MIQSPRCELMAVCGKIRCRILPPGGIAQLVEHWPFKPLVPGSSPGAPTTSRGFGVLQLAI